MKLALDELSVFLAVVDTGSLTLGAADRLAALKTQLKEINERMWVIQDQLRDKEAAQVFDDAFIQLARGVYGTNGERVQVKNEINRVAGSALVEEKQYQGE